MLEIPDASLLRLGSEFEEAVRRFDHEYAALAASERDERFAELHASVDALCDEIEGQTATTLAGLRVKARAAAYPVGTGEDAIIALRHGMAESIIGDLLNLPGFDALPKGQF